MTKTNLILLITGLFLSLNLTAQESDSILVSNIEKTVEDIDSNPNFLRLHEDGVFSKKRFLFFKRRTGSFYSNIVYADSLVLSTENVYSYFKTGKVRTEKFYFKGNKLIKYFKNLSTNQEKPAHRIIAYFNNDRLIKVEKEINDDYVFDLEKQSYIIDKAKKEIELRKMTTREWKNLFGNQ